ncbi:MAG: hypothetical protein Q9212_007606, partial [Teloschistes hypoglaucus]
RLPQIPHVRTLYIPHIADADPPYHHPGTHLDPKELALQLMDVVAFRPAVELCYLGITNKCFEIMEGKTTTAEGVTFRGEGTAVVEGSESEEDSEEDPDDDDDDEDDEDDDGAGAGAGAGAAGVNANHGLIDGEGDGEAEGDDEWVSDGDADSDILTGEEAEHRRQPLLKLREILFYDDRVDVFRVRHRRL